MTMTDDFDRFCPWTDEDDEDRDPCDFSQADLVGAREPAPGLTRRALDVLHGWDGSPPLCAVCTLHAVVAFAHEPGADLRSLIARLSDALYAQAGPAAGIAFDALAYPGDLGRRARFEELAVLLGESAPSSRAEGAGSSAVH